MQISPINRLLVASCGILSFALLLILLLPVGEDWDWESTDSAAAAVSPISLKYVLPAVATTNLDNRPIFDPSRQSAAAEAPPMMAQTAPSSFKLVGIISGPQNRIALIQDSNSKGLVNATVGDIVSNWLVREIYTDHVILEGKGMRQEIWLRYGN